MHTTHDLEVHGRVLPIEDGVTRIGRSITADVELDDIAVSRRHALIVRGEGKAILLDDASRNGVYLNGVRVERAQLQDGDTIKLGKTELHYTSAVRDLIAA